MAEKTNIAFKCNFCNGGSTKDYYGFNGVCSDGVIKHNIKEVKYEWCRHPRCACNRYFNNQITYEQLCQEYEKYGSVCYESAMINKWEAMAGWDHSGIRGERPRRILEAEIGSLAVLTLVLHGMKEDDRRILAMFIIDEYFIGDTDTEGSVSSNSKYRLLFTKKEMNDLKFWDFYDNENTNDERWGSGLFRYLFDEQCIQMLNRAKELKRRTDDEKLAVEMFDVYCRNKGIQV